MFPVQYNVLVVKHQARSVRTRSFPTIRFRKTPFGGDPVAVSTHPMNPATLGIAGQGAASLLNHRPVTAASRKRKRAELGRSESTEDHLERIQELVDQKGFARVTDIAASLGLSRSAVSNMVRRLARRGFVNYERYRGFTLTPAGRQVAQHIKARHKLLTEMFEMLGLDAKTVDREVEDIEHHLRPQTLAVFSRLVQFWREHPAQLQAFLRFGVRR